MVFEPTGAARESLIGNHDALRLPLNIDIGRSRPLTTKMWEQLFREMELAALNTDMRLYELAMSGAAIPERGGLDYIRRQTDRFVITSIEQGSIIIAGAVFLAAAGGWFFKEFIKPGWEKSESKKHWDDEVAGAIDKAVPVLKDQIDYHVVHRLKRLSITRVSIRRPSDQIGRRLSENQTPDTDIIYDKPKQIMHRSKK